MAPPSSHMYGDRVSVPLLVRVLWAGAGPTQPGLEKHFLGAHPDGLAVNHRYDLAASSTDFTNIVGPTLRWETRCSIRSCWGVRSVGFVYEQTDAVYPTMRLHRRPARGDDRLLRRHAERGGDAVAALFDEHDNVAEIICRPANSRPDLDPHRWRKRGGWYRRGAALPFMPRWSPRWSRRADDAVCGRPGQSAALHPSSEWRKRPTAVERRHRAAALDLPGNG